MKLVHIDSSFSGSQSTSSMLSKSVIDQLVKGHEARVHYRDLNQEGLGHLTEEIFSGFQLDIMECNDAQRAAVERSNQYIDELKGADALVLGVPMYNFGVPSVMKAWFDLIARAGVSFRYSENGPEGLLNINKAYVVATRGGQYANTESDHQAPWIEQVLKFVGVKEVEFIYVEGLAGADLDKSIQEASARVDQLISID